jgi:hypothetical protein
MCVAPRPVRGIGRGTPLIVLHTNAGSVIDRLPETSIARVAHRDLFAFAALAGHGRHAGVGPERVIVPLRQGLSGFGEHDGSHPHPDPDQRTKNLDVAVPGGGPGGDIGVGRRHIGLFKTGQQGFNLPFARGALLAEEAEAGKKHGNVRPRGLEGPGRHRKGRSP